MKTDDSERGKRGGSYFDRLEVSVPFVSEPLLVSTLFVGAGLRATCIFFSLSLLTASLCDHLEFQQWNIKIKHGQQFKWEFQIVAIFFKALNALNIQKIASLVGFIDREEGINKDKSNSVIISHPCSTSHWLSYDMGVLD